MKEISGVENLTAPMFLLALVLFSKCHYCISFGIIGRSSGPASTAQEPDNSEVSTEKLCPDGSAYHNATSSCQKLLEKGPCGDLQLFYLVSYESPYGNCACMSNDDGCNPIVKSNRMILPGSDGKQCFWAYSSGPCPDGQWYVLNMKSLKPECQENACYSEDPIVGADEIVLGIGQEETDKFTFVLNNTCYDTYTQAYCPEGQYVQFLGTNDPYPKCFNVTGGGSICLRISVDPTKSVPCVVGLKHVGDNCVKANPAFD